MVDPDVTDRAMAEIMTLIESEVGTDAIDVDTDLFELGVMTSLLVVELVSLIETMLEVTIDDEDVKPQLFRSVRSMAAFVESRR